MANIPFCSEIGFQLPGVPVIVRSVFLCTPWRDARYVCPTKFDQPFIQGLPHLGNTTAHGAQIPLPLGF